MGLRLDITGGMDTVTSPDLTKGWPYLQNVRKNLKGWTEARPPLGTNLLSSRIFPDSTPNSLVRLNDIYGPPAGYAIISGGAGSLNVGTTQVSTGLSGNPLSYLPYRPPSSPRPYCYIADSSMAVSILSPSYAAYGPVAGMLKVNTSGICYKTGIKEPQVAPSVVVDSTPGATAGPNWVSYRYTYRDKNTGATSNPSPESPPQILLQSNVNGTVQGSQYATNLTFNSTQYEFVSVFRTKGGVNPGTVTDYVVAHNFGMSMPANVRVDGVLIGLNWAGQYAGTGVLSGVALFYQGAIIGQVKGPGILNAQFIGASGTTITQGGNSDTWGTVLDAAIVNDNTFGFGVQITTQESGGSDRSFLYTFTITVYYTVLNTTLTCTPSLDPQVNVIDIYRSDPGLDNYTYVGTVLNSAPAFLDTLTDLEVAANPILEYDNFEPFPSIDLPRSGVVNVIDSSGDVNWNSGDLFNIRWLPGTTVLIADSTNGSLIPYTLYNRPSSPTALKVFTSTKSTTGFLTLGFPPAGNNLVYQIAEPELAAQASQVIWGPTPDNAGSFYFGLDPNNPGDLLWSKGNNFDSAPDTNRLFICSPSESLVNGTVTSELSTVFSTDRFWLLYNNFSDAVATVTGTAGQQWVPIQSAATRGLYMRYAIAALGSLIGWRAKDGMFLSIGGGPEQSISENIYNLFTHGGQQPTSITLGGYTIYPPNDALPNFQTLQIIPGYIFYDFVDINAVYHTLVYDMEAKGWSVDVYNPVGMYHSWAVGNVNQVLVGCVDGTVRTFDSVAGTEVGTAVIMTACQNAGSTRTIKRIGGIFIRALAKAKITLAFWANRINQAITGFNPGVIGTSGVESDYLTDLTSATVLGKTSADVNDLSAVFSWPLGSGNILSEWEPDWNVLPESIIGWKTAQISYGAKGWCSIPWINLSYQSTGIVTLVMNLAGNNNDVLPPVTLSFPATGGNQVKQFLTLPPNKFKLVSWTANSPLPFTIYAADSEAMLYSWGEGSKPINPFSGQGFGIKTSTT